MTKRKYITEFALSASGYFTMILQQENLKTIANSPFSEEQPCHIYMVARRPRIMLDPSTIIVRNGVIEGDLKIQRQAVQETRSFRIRNQLGTDNIRIECLYPHTEYTIYDENDNKIASGKVAMLLTLCGNEYEDLLNLEILYIGQSYGVKGARTAPMRLQSHSTLQEIYSEAIRRAPDQDIWLLLWNFELTLITNIDGRFTPTTDQVDSDDPHVERMFKKGITEQQQINFTEAALIKYFQPQYNIMFKDSFPNPAHKTYSECYDLDVNSVSIVLDTEHINSRLWSSEVSPKWCHYENFFLHSFSERKSILEF